jgi:hypothetical protein
VPIGNFAAVQDMQASRQGECTRLTYIIIGTCFVMLNLLPNLAVVANVVVRSTVMHDWTVKEEKQRGRIDVKERVSQLMKHTSTALKHHLARAGPHERVHLTHAAAHALSVDGMHLASCCGDPTVVDISLPPLVRSAA